MIPHEYRTPITPRVHGVLRWTSRGWEVRDFHAPERILRPASAQMHELSRWADARRITIHAEKEVDWNGLGTT